MESAATVPGASEWSRARRLAGLAGLAFLVSLALWPVFSAGFVYDDRLVVLRNPAVAGADLRAIASQPMWAFYSPEAEHSVGYWRPLATLLLSLTYQAAGPSPLPFHALSVGLHLAACAAAWALVRRLTRSDALGWWAAILFGLHPVHVESTAWISALGDPLYGLLALLALERHAAWRLRGSPGAPWAAGVLLVCALLAKELAVGALLCIPLVDLAVGARPFRWRAWTPYLAAIALYWAARALVFQDVLAGLDRTTTGFGVPHLRLLLLRGEILGDALWLMAWPADLRLFHPFVPDAGQAGLLLPLAVLAAWAGACAWLHARGERLLLAAALLAVVPLLAILVRIEALGTFPLSERYLYLPVLGVALLCAAALPRILPRGLATAALLLVATAYGARAHVQARTWSDEQTLFRTAAAASPRVPYVRWEHGRILLEQYRASGDVRFLEGADREFAAALELLTAAQGGDGSIFAVREDHVQANVGIGWVLLYRAELEGERDFGPAADVFRLVTSRYPGSEEAWTGLGVAELARGNLDEARKALERALAENERFVEAHRNLGRLWMQRGDPARARASFEAALRWQPDQPDSLLLLGSALEAEGDDAGAARNFDRAAALAPRDARPRVHQALLAAKGGDLERAARELERAIDLDASNAEAHLAKGKVQAARGERHGALASFQRASDLAPLSFEANYNAGALLLALEGVPQAMPYLIRAYEHRPPGPAGETLATTIRNLPLASPEVFTLLATADADRGLYDSALAWLDDALVLAPDHGSALYLKGGMLKRKGDNAGALAAWTRACERMPDNFALHDSMAGLLMEMGDRDGALRHLEIALGILEKAAATDRTLQQPLDMLRMRIEELRAEK